MKKILLSLFSMILQGTFIGCSCGLVLGGFRFLLEKIFSLILLYYHNSQEQLIALLGLFVCYVLIFLVNSYLIQKEEHIKGSGVPQLEAELLGAIDLNWWTIFWRKYLGGLLGISSGLMLGRGGPSIQLGALLGKGLTSFSRNARQVKNDWMICGAATGIAVAFNAPIAGFLFAMEEFVYRFKLSSLRIFVSSMSAYLISSKLYHLKTVFHLSLDVPQLSLSHYLLLLMLIPILIGIAILYQYSLLHVHRFYTCLETVFSLKSVYHSFLPFLLTLPLGYFLPDLLGGGNHLIYSLLTAHEIGGFLLLFLIIRFSGSVLGFGSGLPAGIFLPSLTLGALIGAYLAELFLSFSLITGLEVPIFILVGMTGYFSALFQLPLTAVFLVIEMSGNDSAFLPMIVVSFLIFFVMKYLKVKSMNQVFLVNKFPDLQLTDKKGNYERFKK